MTQRNFVIGLECKNILTEAVSKRLPLKITNKRITRCRRVDNRRRYRRHFESGAIRNQRPQAPHQYEHRVS